MKCKSKQEILDMLDKYINFDECPLLDIRCDELAVSWELVIDYLYDADGHYRKNMMDVDEIVILKFNMVQKFYFETFFSDIMLENPQDIGDGIATIETIQLKDDKKYLEPYASSPYVFHHIRVYNGSLRDIDIVFSDVEVIEQGESTIYMP